MIAFIFLEKDHLLRKESPKIDYRGTVLFMIGLPALTYGSSLIPSVAGWLLLVTGSILLILFWVLESRAANPMFDTKLFTHNRLFAFSNIASLINYTATFAIVFFLSLYLQKIKGLAPQDAGMIIIAQPLMMAIFSPLVGSWSDKIQPRYFATLGMAMCTIGLAAFAFLDEKTPLWVIVVILLWVGLGFGLFSSPNTNTIMSSVKKTQYGQASGTAASMRMIGQIFSMTIATLFFAILFDGETVSEVSVPTFLSAVRRGFATFALIGFVGIYFSSARGNLNRD
jgi:MFS family permease